MIKMKVKIDGLEKLRRGFYMAPQRTLNEMSRAIKKSIFLVERYAKREAPVNKRSGGGNLRQMIKAEMKGMLRGVVLSDANYSGYVHDGVDSHVRTSAFGRPTKPYIHPGQEENPYLERALEKCKSKIEEYFKKAIDNVFKKF